MNTTSAALHAELAIFNAKTAAAKTVQTVPANALTLNRTYTYRPSTKL